MVQYHIYLRDQQERILDKEALHLGISTKELIQQIAKLKVAQIQSKLSIPSPSKVQICSIKDCGKPVLAKGLCSAHYQRLRYRRIQREKGVFLAQGGEPSP